MVFTPTVGIRGTMLPYSVGGRDVSEYDKKFDKLLYLGYGMDLPMITDPT